jgi:plastocyanin
MTSRSCHTGPVMALLLLAGIILAAGCASSQPAGSSVPGTQASQTAVADSPATPAVSGDTSSGSFTASIVIQNFAFVPDTLTVRKGTTVTWQNTDSVSHTVVTDPGSPEAFSSPTLSVAGSFPYTFTVPGTYPYHCGIHPSMHGTIIVTP